MSLRRTQKETGWGPPLKDHDGNPICRRCKSPVPKGHRTFCSKECVHEWRLRTDPGYLRLKVFERDQGVCGKCGVDVFEKAFWRNGSKRTRRDRGSGDLWQADHILPVAEGGGECDLSNMRTLCTKCHKEESAELARRMAKSRSAQLDLNIPERVA